MELHEQAAQIASREDLVAFIEALRNDLLQNPAGWENPTLESFLDALAAWSTATEHLFKNTGEQPPLQPGWRLIGEMLYAAKIYE